MLTEEADDVVHLRHADAVPDPGVGTGGDRAVFGQEGLQPLRGYCGDDRIGRVMAGEDRWADLGQGGIAAVQTRDREPGQQHGTGEPSLS